MGLPRRRRRPIARDVTLRFLGDAGNLQRTFAAVETQATRTFGKLSAATADAASTMGSKMEAATAALATAGTRASRAGRTLTRNMSLPLLAVGGLGIKVAADYEKNMNVLQAASGATGGEMASFGKLAQQLGGDITLPGTSAGDAAAAMLELSKAGLSVTDTMSAARGVLQLSAAGGLDNAAAATVAANALNAFKLGGDQATRVADLLAGAANGSSASVAGLADSLAMGASVFAAAGVPIEDFITSAAMLSQVGVQGSEAGTALKTMLQRLQNPTKESAELMKQMGVDIYDAEGRMRPFRDLIGQFTSATAGMAQEQRDAAVATIFGSDAVRGANAVLLGGMDAFDRMKVATTEQGAAAKMAAAQNKGLGGAIDGLKSAIETFALKVLVPALPVLTNFVQKLASMPTPVLAIGAALVGLAAVAGPLVFMFGTLATAVAAVSLPVAGAIVGIVALGAAVGAAYARFEGFRNVVDTAVRGIVATVQGAVAIVQTTAGVAAGIFTSVVNGIKSGVNVVIKVINGLITAYNKLPFVDNVSPIAELEMLGGDKKADPRKAVDPRAVGPTASGPLPGKTLAAGAMGPALGAPIGLAHGGLLLGLNRPTPILAGEGHGKEDVLAVPHSKGGIGGMGGIKVDYTFHGVPLEEAMQRSQRDLSWRLALAGRR